MNGVPDSLEHDDKSDLSSFLTDLSEVRNWTHLRYDFVLTINTTMSRSNSPTASCPCSKNGEEELIWLVEIEDKHEVTYRSFLSSSLQECCIRQARELVHAVYHQQDQSLCSNQGNCWFVSISQKLCQLVAAFRYLWSWEEAFPATYGGEWTT